MLVPAFPVPDSAGVDQLVAGASISAKPLGYISYPENPERFLNEIPTCRDKPGQDRYVASLYVITQLLGAKLSRYILNSERFAPQRKSDGMFPFHSFW
jgi:hypothetical protein